jgi:hypothetical protein
MKTLGPVLADLLPALSKNLVLGSIYVSGRDCSHFGKLMSLLEAWILLKLLKGQQQW